jgi:hypothetical protein
MFALTIMLVGMETTLPKVYSAGVEGYMNCPTVRCFFGKALPDIICLAVWISNIYLAGVIFFDLHSINAT